MILVSAIVMFVLANSASIGVIYVLLFVVYYCYGTCLSVFPSTVADFFGTKNLGINYGWVFTSWGVAGIVGPMIAGYMFKTYQSYTGAFYTAGILAIVSLIAMLVARRPEPVTVKATA